MTPAPSRHCRLSRYISSAGILLHGGGEKPAFLDAAKKNPQVARVEAWRELTPARRPRRAPSVRAPSGNTGSGPLADDSAQCLILKADVTLATPPSLSPH